MDLFTSKRGAIYLLAALIIMILSPACGKKAPPRPPGATPLPAINSLKSTTRGEVLWLTWSIPEKMGDRISDVVGFVIYRSKVATIGSSCENCPVVFKKLNQVPLEGAFSKGIGKEIFSFEDVLEINHRYVYQVSTLTSSGQESPGSNQVTVTY